MTEKVKGVKRGGLFFIITGVGWDENECGPGCVRCVNGLGWWISRFKLADF